MISIQLVDYTTVIAFWLVFVRMAAILSQFPLFDNVAVPAIAKILTTIFISFSFFPYVGAELMKDIQYVGVESFWMLTIFNVIIGLLIGFFVKVIMQMYVGAGAMITQQVGFAALRYFDPNAGSQLGPFEKIIQWTILILILSSGALIPMFKGCYASFFNIHIYEFGKLAASVQFYTQLFKSIFLSSVMLASPLIFTNLMIMGILGVIARTVPQMNVLMVSFVINIGVGLLVFYSVSGEFFQLAFKLYTEKLGEWFQLIT